MKGGASLSRVLSRILSFGEKILEVMVGRGCVPIGRSLLVWAESF